MADNIDQLAHILRFFPHPIVDPAVSVVRVIETLPPEEQQQAWHVILGAEAKIARIRADTVQTINEQFGSQRAR